MRIILGIGNPGREYAGTRHNCGFLVVDALAQRHGLTAWRKDWNADVCEWAVPPALGGGKALLLKPRCYVNLSGGVAQAALDKTAEYVTQRSQFGQPTITFGLTQYHLGRMAHRLAAARAITYAAALAMDEDERKAATLAAQAKLLACDVAVEVTQLGQLLHGGWGYAEEYAISRYVIDAQVLPIFEGVKPILALKVVGRALLSGPAS